MGLKFLKCFLSTTKPCSFNLSTICCDVTEPNNFPPDPVFTAIASERFSSLLPTSCAFCNSSDSLAALAIMRESRRFLLERLSGTAFFLGKRKLRAKPALTLTMSPSNPRFSIFSSSKIYVLAMIE